MYDGDNNLVKSIINGKSTYYLGKLYQKKLDGETVTVQKYYSSGSAQIAVRTIQGEEDTLQWLLSDHLGSTSTTANADGTWNSTIQYSAFGEIRASSGITPTEFRYTGQMSQAELGLYYYVARWYDPELAHFVQADTIVPNAGDSTAYDRFAYVKNNPIKYNDPSGHDVGCAGRDASVCSGMNNQSTNISPFLYYYGSMFGEFPDYRGIDIATQHVKNDKKGDTTVVAAAIAVQSQYYYESIDTFTAGITNGGLGIAQVGRSDMESYGVPGGDPLDPDDAILAMQGRMNNLADLCVECNATEILIVKMLAQNNGVSPYDIKAIIKKNKDDQGNPYVKWEKYFNKRRLTSSWFYNFRAKNYYQYDTRFMIKLMFNDLIELQNQGWVLPSGVDWDEIQNIINSSPNK